MTMPAIWPLTLPVRTRRTYAGALTLAALCAFPLTARAQTASPPANEAPPTVTVTPTPTHETPPAAEAPVTGPAAAPAHPPPASAPGSPPPASAPPPAYPPPPPYAPPPAYAPPPPAYAPPPPYAPPPGYPSPGYPPPPAYPPPSYWQRPPYGAAYQPVPAPPPGFETHDGFFLRLHLGGGFTSISGSNGAGATARLSGGSLSIGVALGGAITQDLIIFGAVAGTIISDPTLTLNGVQGPYGSTSGSSASVGGTGAGLAYYLEPVNVYLSGALMLVTFELDDANNKAIYQSKTGVGFQGIVGKEWWVSTNWGLGLAGEIYVATMKDKTDPNTNWTSSAFSLLFSATYN
jgi:hypothetical protein